MATDELTRAKSPDKPRVFDYGVYAGYISNHEVWLEQLFFKPVNDRVVIEERVKHTFINGFPTSEKAFAAVRRYRVARNDALGMAWRPSR